MYLSFQKFGSPLCLLPTIDFFKADSTLFVFVFVSFLCFFEGRNKVRSKVCCKASFLLHLFLLEWGRAGRKLDSVSSSVKQKCKRVKVEITHGGVISLVVFIKEQ